MPEAIIKKNGTDYPIQTMPLHYPADRVYLDGDTSKTVQDAILPTHYDFGAQSSLDSAIRALHNSLADGQIVSATLKHENTESYVCGYRAFSTRGRYLCLVRTVDDIVGYRITGTNTMSKTVFSGTTTTVNV